MKIKDIRTLIAGLPDETDVVVSDRDHTYRRARVAVVTAETDGERGGYLGEYHDEESNGPECKTVRVLLVGF